MNFGRKRLARTIVTVLIIAVTALSVSASYPCSTRAKPSEGTLLEGELIGTAPYGGNQGSNFTKAWDGDRSTFFDPTDGATDACYTGVILEGTYVLTEVRILPRSDFLDRFNGAEIQGSNDGESWETIWVSHSGAGAAAFNYISADQLKNNDGYSMYRYVNKKEHGDVAEIELYGVETEPPVSEEELAAKKAEEEEQMAILMSEREEIAQHVVTSPSSYDKVVVILIALCVSGVTLVTLSVISIVSKIKKKKK